MILKMDDFLSSQQSLASVGFWEPENQIPNVTPWKINMEPTNQPFRKENDLPNPYDYVPC